MNRTAPTLLVYGGNYANEREIGVEDILPFVFPYGIGGPKMNRRVRVSLKECIKRYSQTAMPQLMREEVKLVLYHVLGKQVLYNSSGDD